MAVAKAAAKKPAVAKAKATKAVKAVAKKPAVAKAAKVAKAVVKKPAAKFNFNKLIMLIIRDVPKKGKKMTGGVKDTDVEQIRTKIIEFVGKKRNRITTLLNTVDIYGIHKNMSDADIAKDISKKWEGDIHSLILHIYNNKIVSNADLTLYPDDNKLQEYLTSESLTYPKKDDHTNDKGVFDKLFMIVVVALCKVYGIINITQNV
jgi:hypothetical protein